MPSPRRSSPFSRPRWTEQDARAALAALEQSGQSVRVFAEGHGLDPQRLYVWRRRLGKAEPTTFRELIVRPSLPVAAEECGARFELVLPSGVVLRVPSRFDVSALERLLAVLAEARAC
jgi:transposase-like protein